jgi:ATP-dependent Lon protease
LNIIKNYCDHEAGVRNLRKALDRVFRKVAANLEFISPSEEDKKGASSVMPVFQVNT